MTEREFRYIYTRWQKNRKKNSQKKQPHLSFQAKRFLKPNSFFSERTSLHAQQSSK